MSKCVRGSSTKNWHVDSVKFKRRQSIYKYLTDNHNNFKIKIKTRSTIISIS